MSCLGRASRRARNTPRWSSASPAGARCSSTSSSCCCRRACRARSGSRCARALYPLLLGACGRNVVFGQNVVLRHPHKIRIGDNVVIDDNCLIDAKGDIEHRHPHRRAACSSAATRSCRARTATSIWPTARTSASTARFSRRAACGSGANALIAAYCYLIGGDHDFSDAVAAGARAGAHVGRRHGRRRRVARRGREDPGRRRHRRQRGRRRRRRRARIGARARDRGRRSGASRR